MKSHCLLEREKRGVTIFREGVTGRVTTISHLSIYTEFQ